MLNLSAIGVRNAENPQYRAKPMFMSPVINSAIVLKHRVRSDEGYLFNGTRASATKIIVPFDAHDLRAGGRSFFIDQRGFQDMLREIGHYGGADMKRDMEALHIVDGLPSLDPFLLRESLRVHEIECADCYFEINAADQERMFDYVSKEMRKLIQLATGEVGGTRSPTQRLVAALLSSEVDDKLEPLRLTLGMDNSNFREGVFSWRGFLYYKWGVEKVWPDTIHALRALRAAQPIGAADNDAKAFLTASRQAIIEKVRDAGAAIRKVLAIYDGAYADLVHNQTPATFREFLLSAPYLFLDLGEKMGALSHIASFWRYRFPPNAPMRVEPEELASIFQDFVSTLPGAAVAR